ncbi:MAG: hypothetical protein H6585_07500 [Flavobacteriales bacterium]|nr:hypothetical protein [Flavobacteriales bacterium]MCB9448171.1 hypothetical protein [Flavobacteriales bacterium]
MEATLAQTTDQIIERLKRAQADLEDLRDQLRNNQPSDELKFEGIRNRFNTFLEEVALMFDNLNELRDKLEAQKSEQPWENIHVDLERSYEEMKKLFRV